MLVRFFASGNKTKLLETPKAVLGTKVLMKIKTGWEKNSDMGDLLINPSINKLSLFIGKNPTDIKMGNQQPSS